MVAANKKTVNKLMKTNLFTFSTVLYIILSGFASLSSGAPVAIDPHWTGKHCLECHTTNKGPDLKFNGSVTQVCNRCHGDSPPPCVKVHSESINLSEIMKETIPIDWPLEKEKITCLTCHAARLQMHTNKKVENENNNFLRGAEPNDLVNFCFSCHQKERFKKTNPHQHTNRDVCFRCHTKNLSMGLEVSFESSVKTKNPSLCLGCHGNLSKGHLEHVLIERDKLDAHKMVLDNLQNDYIELPLADGKMHCSTCHNQHPEGIIGRKEAAIGAGEEHLLRIPTNHLCAVCHTDKPVSTYMERFLKK
jgi:hypothetical protein